MSNLSLPLFLLLAHAPLPIGPQLDGHCRTKLLLLEKSTNIACGCPTVFHIYETKVNPGPNYSPNRRPPTQQIIMLPRGPGRSDAYLLEVQYPLSIKDGCSLVPSLACCVFFFSLAKAGLVAREFRGGLGLVRLRLRPWLGSRRAGHATLRDLL